MCKKVQKNTNHLKVDVKLTYHMSMVNKKNAI